MVEFRRREDQTGETTLNGPHWQSAQQGRAGRPRQVRDQGARQIPNQSSQVLEVPKRRGNISRKLLWPHFVWVVLYVLLRRLSYS